MIFVMVILQIIFTIDSIKKTGLYNLNVGVSEGKDTKKCRLM